MRRSGHKTSLPPRPPFSRTAAVGSGAVVRGSHGERMGSAERWCIAVAAAHAWIDERASPFCDDGWIEVGATSRIGEGAIRWRISWVLMCR